VVSNATPKAMASLVDRMADGDVAAARDLHMKLTPWMHAAFIESNPLGAKAALAMLGRIRNVLRLPLVPLAPQHEPVIRDALRVAGALA
jgi:4-hydroxy-tetrahydrodipicolinate synthase